MQLVQHMHKKDGRSAFVVAPDDWAKTNAEGLDWVQCRLLGLVADAKDYVPHRAIRLFGGELDVSVGVVTLELR